jgi:hypothetical protein
MSTILLVVLVFGLFILFSSFFTVKQQTAAIIERFGKFLSIRHSGLQLKIPLIDRIAGRVNLKIQQDVHPFASNPFSMSKSLYTMEIQSKEQWVLHRLEKFYSENGNLQRIESILQGNSKISLRLIDWLVTNYAKKHNISYLTKKGSRHVIVYLAYKSHLKAYSKKMFDPFCRWKRIQFLGLNTTVGQLNFFEWAMQDEVLDYLEENYDAVQSDMDTCSTVIQTKEDGSRRKRHELSRSATKSVCRHDICVSIKFD